MDDELSSGPDTPPRRVARVVTVAALAAAAVAYGVTHTGGSGGGHRATPAATTTTRAPAALPTAGPPSTPASPVASVPAQDVQPELAGVTRALPPGITLLLGGPHPRVVGAASPITLAHVPVHQDESVSRLVPAKDGLVVQVDTAIADPLKPSARFYWVRAGGRTTLIGTGDDMVLGARRDRVLIVRYGYAPNTSADQPGSVTQVALDGKVLAISALPAGTTAEADTEQGLVTLTYADQSDTSGRLELRDRTTLHVLRQLGSAVFVVTADANRLVWEQPGCGTQCALTELDLRTGVRHTVAVAANYYVGSAAISPDGTKLALGYYGRHPQQPGGQAAGFVEVVDLSTDLRHRVPGLATAIKQTADLAWLPDGRRLAVSVGWPADDVRRIGLWSAGDPQLTVLPGRYVGGYAPSALIVRPSTS